MNLSYLWTRASRRLVLFGLLAAVVVTVVFLLVGMLKQERKNEPTKKEFPFLEETPQPNGASSTTPAIPPTVPSPNESEVKRIILVKENPPRTMEDLMEDLETIPTHLYMDIWEVNRSEDGKLYLVGRATDATIEWLKQDGFSVEVLYQSEEEYIKKAMKAMEEEKKEENK